MNNKNLVIATIVGVTLIASVMLPKGVGDNKVAKVPSVYADVPLTLELPFLYSQNLLTNNVQKEGMALSKAAIIPNATPIAHNKEEIVPIVQESAKEGEEDSFNKNVPLSAELQKFTIELCDKYNISYDLIFAIIRQESNFQTSLISKTNDYGIMQINHGNFNKVKKFMKSEFHIDNFNWKNPKQNIEAGVFWFKIIRDEMLNKGYSEEEIFPISILAYNMGAPKADRYLKSHDAYDWEYVKAVSYYKTRLEKGESINDDKPKRVAS